MECKSTDAGDGKGIPLNCGLQQLRCGQVKFKSENVIFRDTVFDTCGSQQHLKSQKPFTLHSSIHKQLLLDLKQNKNQNEQRRASSKGYHNHESFSTATYVSCQCLCVTATRAMHPQQLRFTTYAQVKSAAWSPQTVWHVTCCMHATAASLPTHSSSSHQAGNESFPWDLPLQPFIGRPAFSTLPGKGSDQVELLSTRIVCPAGSPKAHRERRGHK